MSPVSNTRSTGHTQSLRETSKLSSDEVNSIVNGTIKMDAQERAAHKKALDTLSNNYGDLPKDPATGYVSKASMLSVLEHPERFSREVRDAVTYFKNHPNQYTALETSRERYEQKKTDGHGDGLFSREDIGRERMHGDKQKAEPKAMPKAKAKPDAPAHPAAAFGADLISKVRATEAKKAA